MINDGDGGASGLPFIIQHVSFSDLHYSSSHRTEANVDKTFLRRSRIARIAALLAMCLIVTGGVGIVWLPDNEISEVPQNAAATKALTESGAIVRCVVIKELRSPSFEPLVRWLPEALIEPLAHYRMLPVVRLEGDQVNDANLARLRSIRGLDGVTISRATLTDDWIDFIAERRVAENTRVEVIETTAASDRGRALVAELEKEQLVFAQALPAPNDAVPK